MSTIEIIFIGVAEVAALVLVATAIATVHYIRKGR